MHAAGRADLHQVKLPLELRVQRQQAIDGAEPLGNALRVIDPIDPDEQLARALPAVRITAQPELLAQLPGFRLLVGGGVRAISSGSMLIGWGWTTVVCPLRVTENRSVSTLASMARSTVSRKLLQWY
jgi:hypothetical protein